jgi:hypothetical protein
MALELPYRFDDPFEEAARRAQEFQRLPPDERLRQLMDVIETGLALLRASPHREVSERLFQERETEWQRIQKELFLRHGV